jgi:exonuclease VII small subunit
MIKFFRKIRKNMLTENKFSKYLLYAIGEIFLVVIGILIALSINNWNTKENERELEIKYLNQIKSSLESSELNLTESIDRNKEIFQSGELLLKHLKDKKPLNDTIVRLFIIPQYDQSIRLSTAAFENLKNDGLSLISNDSLKIAVIDIYEQEITLIQNTFANQIENFNTSIVGPFYNKHFELDTKTKEPLFIPNNYEDLLQNREMTNMLSNVNGLRLYSITFYESVLEKIRKIIIKVENEIKTLEE